MRNRKDSRRLYGQIGAAGIILLALGLIQILSLPIVTKVQRVLVDFGHVPVFALVAFALVKLTSAVIRTSNGQPAPRDYLISALVVLALAVFSEAVQLLNPGRVVSIADVLRNVAGGALGLFLCAARYPPAAEAASRRGRAMPLAAASVLLAGLLFPVVWTSAAHVYRATSWPVVLGGNYRLEIPYTVAYGSELDIVRTPQEWRLDDRESALQLRIQNCVQCGMLVQELSREWEGLTRICLELTNPEQETLRLSVRLGDGPMFFRSSVFTEFGTTIDRGRREVRCVPLSSIGEGKPSASGHRSLALLSDTREHRRYFIHRIWLQ